MNIEIAFGEILKRERTKRSLSQEELAYLSDLDRTFISMLERGKRQPSLKTIFVLTSALDIRPSQMLHDIEDLLSF